MLSTYQVPPDIEQIGNRCMSTQQPLRSRPIALCLKIDINNLAILIDSPLQVMLLTVDLYEDLIDEKRIAVAAVLSFQTRV
jgi:hypothetical protein